MDIKVLALLCILTGYIGAAPCDKVDENAIAAKRKELDVLEAKLKQQEKSGENRLKLEQLHKEQEQLIEDLRKKTAEEEAKKKQLEEELLSNAPCSDATTTTSAPHAADEPCKKKFVVVEEEFQQAPPTIKAPCKKKYIVVEEETVQQAEPSPIIVQSPCPNAVAATTPARSADSSPCYKKYVVLQKDAQTEQEKAEVIVQTPCSSDSASPIATTPSAPSSSRCYKTFVLVQKDGQKVEPEKEIVVEAPCAAADDVSASTAAPTTEASKPAEGCFKKFIVVQKEGQKGQPEEIIVQAPCDDVAATTEAPAPTTSAPCQQRYIIVEKPSADAAKKSDDADSSADNDNIDWAPYDAARLDAESNTEEESSDSAKDEKETPADKNGVCPDGWEVFEDSCYMIERDEKLPLDKAESKCQDLGANLFVPNSKEEYDMIIADAPVLAFTWVGLYKKEAEGNPEWQTTDAIDFEKIDWLISPYSDASNGWSTVSQCAAHYRCSSDLVKYAYWYPCSFSHHFICERNATIHGVETKKFF